MALLKLVTGLVSLLAGILPSGECFVITSKIELPSPEAVGLDSSLSPKLVKAFYEVNFVPAAYEGLHDKLGEASILAPDPTAPRGGCKYPTAFCKSYNFVQSKVTTVQKVEDMIRSAVTDEPVVIPLGFGESRLLNEINRTVNRVVNISPPPPGRRKPAEGNATRAQPPDPVPVYKGLIDTQAVLEKEETPEATHRPPVKPYHPQTRPFFQSGRSPWKDNPCLRNPCPPDVWLKAPYPEVRIDKKI